MNQSACPEPIDSTAAEKGNRSAGFCESIFPVFFFVARSPERKARPISSAFASAAFRTVSALNGPSTPIGNFVISKPRD